MNIANSIHSDNPISEVLSATSIQSDNRSLAGMASKLRFLALNSAKEGKSLDSVERRTWDMILLMGREVIELFLRAVRL